MKRILLASAACLALSLPALAQNNAQSNDASLKAGTQGHGQPASMAANLKQAEINPSTLTRDEIRGIQESLDKAGFNTKKADGVWGPETRDAIMNYQKQKSLPGNGELNQATLDSLRGDLTNQTGSSGQTMNGASASTANHNAEPANMGGSNAAGSNAK